MDSGFALTFPILLASDGPNGAFILSGEILGTAFALSDQFMMTARHVAQEVQGAHPRFGVVALSDPSNGGFKGARIVDIELLAGDVAVMKVDFVFQDSSLWFFKPKWRRAPLNAFDQVRAVGFPYGMHRVDDTASAVQRGFQGHIVSQLPTFRPHGWAEAAFPVYEISFAAPRGLSGAPLLNCAGDVHVHGVIIGNSQSKMLIFESEEKISEPAGVTIVEHYESLHLGVAVTGDFVGNLRSSILGSTIHEHLAARGQVI